VSCGLGDVFCFGWDVPDVGAIRRSNNPVTDIDWIKDIIRTKLTDWWIDISRIDLDNIKSYGDLLSDISEKNFTDVGLKTRVEQILWDVRGWKQLSWWEEIFKDIIKAFKTWRIL